MSLSISLSKISFTSDALIQFMRREGGWALFAGGLALIQVVFTAGVIADVIILMFNDTFHKMAWSESKIFLTAISFGSFGASFLESVMFFFILNKKGGTAKIIAYLTGGIGFFSKVKVPSLVDNDWQTVVSQSFTMFNVTIFLLIVATIFSIKKIAEMFNDREDSIPTPSNKIHNLVEDRLLEITEKEIIKLK